MNKCPQCGTNYTDASLRFCLADGAALVSSRTEEPTVISGRRDAIRVDMLDPASSTAARPTILESKVGSSLPKIIAILAILILLALVVVGAGVGIFYFTGSQKTPISNSAEPKPTASPTATVDAEKERLKNELANLQKKLDEKSTTVANGKPFPVEKDEPELDAVNVATVNSPGDGFLALRSEPSSDYGERIAQIPHGSRLAVVSCESKLVTIGSRRGKWCLIEWNGRAGWVFDAWLTYR